MRRFVVIPKRISRLSFRSTLFCCHSEARSAQESVVPCSTTALYPRTLPFPFFLTLQNELTPNHANITVKKIATTSHFNPDCPA